MYRDEHISGAQVFSRKQRKESFLMLVFVSCAMSFISFENKTRAFTVMCSVEEHH